MDPTTFILKAAIISSTLVPCHTPHAEPTVYSLTPQGVPVEQWPQPKEYPESPHLPHEEQTLRITVDSGTSGSYTNSSVQTTHVNISAHLD